MIISLINHTRGKIKDAEAQRVIRAINRQVEEDFVPYWGYGARLRLEGKSLEKPDHQLPVDMRGDAILYFWDEVDVDGALGYHDKNNRGIPFGFVFTELSKELGEDWSVTLSHEVLELVADPETNLLVQGPHPDPSEKRDVFHWYEMCDAVQAETYVIDGVKVSNFLLPLYFTSGEELGGRNDFLGTVTKGTTLRSFSVNPGGYVGFFDPKIGDDDQFQLKGDKVAAKRAKIKGRYKQGRRATKAARLQRLLG